jgi:hypothetical protein
MRSAILDTIEVTGVTGITLYTLGQDIELIFKILVSAVSLGFVIYKWWKESKRP